MGRRRGNINYKYLRRRKSWFRRNLRALIAYAVVILILIGVIVFVVTKFAGNNKNDKAQNQAETTQAATEPATEVKWVELKEKETVKAIDYTVPEGIDFPYMIKVNRAANCVTVYGIDSQGEYSIPVKAFAASCGREGQETITGDNYKLSDKYVWRLMVDNTYGHYAYRINGGYLFHSVPYYTASNDKLETEEYNKLGSFASLGCVRMCVRDVLWLYENCPVGTYVSIYDDEANPGPLGKPESIKIPLDSPNAGWDPTDPNESNPWLKESAKIEGAKNITVKRGGTVDLLEGVTAKDTCGNDITGKIVVTGTYTLDMTGEYAITYKVTDAIGSVATAQVKLIVTE